MIQTADYILPTDTCLNPVHPEGESAFYTRKVGFIMRPDGLIEPTFIFTASHDGPGFGYSDWALGAIFECLHDQTDEDLGDLTVVGRINFDTGETEGNVPDIDLPHAVFK